MFRELTRKNKQLDTDECIKLLKNEKRGVLSVMGDDSYPYGMPMNHFYNEDDGTIYFHCGRGGHREEAILKSDKVSFCVYNSGTLVNDSSWILSVESVVVFGRASLIDDREQVISITDKLCRKFTSDDEYIQKEIKNFADKTVLIKLIPEHICGKRVTEA